MSDADTLLVRKAQAGDAAAFDALVVRTCRLVYARLYLEVGDRHEAEDLAQETFFIAFRTLKQLSDPANFRGWLLRIAHNAAVDAARHAGRQKRTPAPAVLQFRQALREVPRPDVLAEQKESRAQVLAALRQLPDEYRLALTLRYFAGADCATMETQLGLSNGAVRGILHRGLQKLRALLVDEDHKLSASRQADSGL